ncbi:MAG: DUF547 domain-containing protein [Myxococcota bacterium]|nr:DUF547 domain-containing protein [Myxococcota bacterium]
MAWLKIVFVVYLGLSLSCDTSTFEAPDDQTALAWTSRVLQGSGLKVDPEQLKTLDALDHFHLDAVLRRYMTENGGDYLALSRDPEALNLLSDYKLILDGVRPESMRNPDERIAFWLNAYIGLLLDSIAGLVQEFGPDVEVSHDDFAIYTQVQHRVAGFKLTLEEIGHIVLRGHLGYPDVADTPTDLARNLMEQHHLLFPNGQFDPRINFAISFGARGFPGMPVRAYHADRLEETLHQRTQDFINDETYGANGLGVSALFEWFRRDFIAAAGSVDEFIRQYRSADKGSFNVSGKLLFDWSLR